MKDLNPKYLNQISGGDNEYSVDFVGAAFGEPSKVEDEDNSDATGDATGHFDLWDGER
jgi:hypothetical protein